MAHLFFTGACAAAAALPISDREEVSPVWSIYDDYCCGASQHAEVDDPQVEGEGVGNCGGTTPPRLPFISGPVSSMTLKGAQLKKEAPIRRGAQGAVYSALDVATSAPAEDEKAKGLFSPEACRGHEGEAQVADGGQRPARRGRRVAVKRIFIQASDFGARDISATVLREVTLHRFVSEKQAACLAAAGAFYPTGSTSDATALAEADQGQTLCNLIDDSARVIHLYRVVEAPHKEMCLVMELAATNLEQVVFPHGARGASRGDGAGGYKRKPGVVSLFGSSASIGVGGGLGLSSASPSTAPDAATAEVGPQASSPSPPPSRMPLVRYVMRRLLRLVCFLHETCCVVHRDLKLSNVLVSKDAGLRLGDFGSARFIPPLRSATKTGVENSPSVPEPPAAPAGQREHLLCTPPSIRTTLHYRPPEALLGDQVCRTAADVWALGVIFAQLLLQKGLFHSESELDLLGAIQKLLGMPTYSAPPSWLAAPSVPGPPRERESAAHVPAPQASLPYKFHTGVVPADGLDLLSRMLHQQPECRVTAREALQHPFLNLEGLSAAATHDDDERGRVLWEERVATVLREQATGHIYGMGGGERRPMLISLADNEDEEDQEDDEVGVAPFCVNLGGCTSY
ncbi:putative protein kinase [Leishmania major strain Friedlin]|uniref:Protein kinase domain-containing protein n=1 Tax=Leishmania major TaxID=5664 RepID=Q4Q7B6_LEIMA|nr:putative protein kinase [Leishmania major strain Friedlin]CAG9578411.1 protein_kinase_-_putative [Leishmania major strain Friedlin]CAJ06327.1 putative protein kinase [Leishmania major strain Friedlin]|eukprot:XP_001684782.1 putative protein kinase [Leishmania major strain Friedlin]